VFGASDCSVRAAADGWPHSGLAKVSASLTLHLWPAWRNGTQQLADNALVSWVVHPQPWILERELIGTLDVPLNLQDNKHNAFHAVLTRLRAEAERNARELPMLDE
jgi:GIY-YIG catalytic domain-containing protein